MKKALFIATYGGFFSSCEMINIEILKSMGYEVHGVANFDVVEHNEKPRELTSIGLIQHNIQFSRNPISFSHLHTYRQLKELIKKENYELIDTHNPIVSVFSRMAARKLKIKKVIYTVHGFFFYKGCPILNRLIYKTIENIMAKYTDALIVINKEDYTASKNMNIRGKSYYVPGVGINLNIIKNKAVDLDLRKELKLSKNAFLLLSVGELNNNKNHRIVIKAMAEMVNKGEINNLHYCICGHGNKKNYLSRLIEKCNLKDRVHLLGYRKDVLEIYKSCNIFVIPSLREGLSVSIMEAMACKLPIIASNIRGNVDLVEQDKGGYLFDPKCIHSFNSVLRLLHNDSKKCIKFGNYNCEKAEKYSDKRIKDKMIKIYKEILN